MEYSNGLRMTGTLSFGKSLRKEFKNNSICSSVKSFSSFGRVRICESNTWRTSIDASPSPVVSLFDELESKKQSSVLKSGKMKQKVKTL